MSYEIYSGQVSNGVILENWDRMYVSSGGTANSTTVNGNVYVFSGGVANTTTVNSGGDMKVYNGGTANYTTVNDFGSMHVSEGGTANYTTVNSGGRLVLLDGGNSYDITVFAGGQLGWFCWNEERHWDSIVDGKIADNVFIADSNMYISSGGTANSTTVSGGWMYVEYGGVANSTVLAGSSFYDDYNNDIYDYGFLYVSNGGVANATIVKKCGSMYIYAGGVAKETVLGGVDDAYNKYGAKLEIYAGGAAYDTVVYRSCGVFIRGGAMSRTLVTGTEARVRVYSGVVDDTVVKNGGEFSVSNGGVATSAVVKNNGEICVWEGGKLASASASDYGTIYVFTGGSADAVTVDTCGELHIARGGTATMVRENGGCVEIVNGANVTFAENSFSGMVISSGMMTVHSGTVANATTVAAGTLAVYEGGIADSLEMTHGTAEIHDGGVLTGEVSIKHDAVVSAYDGGIVDFDISDVAPGSAPRINDLSAIVGTPSFTITVSATQTAGVYALADGAAGFAGTITVKTDAGATLGKVSLGANLKSGVYTYALGLEAARLSFTVSAEKDVTPPAKPTAKASTAALTNQNVTVTATFSADSAQKQYSLDNKTWKTYTAAITMSANGSVYFRGIDAAGNVSDVTKYAVTNIDKVAPAKPTAKTSTTALTNQNVTVTATFSADSAQKQYSLDNKTWKTYTAAITMSANGSVYFRGIDAAGNVSKVTKYTVTNIDKGTRNFSGDIGYKGNYQDTFSVALNYPGWYTVTGSFGVLNGSVSILQGKKTVASGTIKKGVLTFNKGKNVLLDSANKYTIVVKNSDKGKSASKYNFNLKGQLFTTGNKTDDNWQKKDLPTLAAGKKLTDWVGYGDKIDYRKLAVDKKGGFYSFKLSGVSNKVKLTVYAKNGNKLKQIKSITVPGKNTSTGDLCLKGEYYLAVEAPGAAKAQNSHYTVTMTGKGTFNHFGNETCGKATWRNATTANIGDGLLTTAAGGDKIDYFDLSAVKKQLKLDAGQGKLKVSFYDKNNKAVKVAQVKMANNSVKKNVSALILVANDKVTDRITLGALDDAIRYLKIEAATKNINTYKLSLLA